MTADPHNYVSPFLGEVLDDALTFFALTPIEPLPPNRFLGAGVYALYYTGEFLPYRPLAIRTRVHFDQPIYVGKAVPQGWRTAREGSHLGLGLFTRLSEHARRIEQTSSLSIQEFSCRYVTLAGTQSALIAPVESALIRKHHPLWNTTVEGFGLHHVGATRFTQARSEWDVLHPGRPWAANMSGPSRSVDDVLNRIQRALE